MYENHCILLKMFDNRWICALEIFVQSIMYFLIYRLIILGLKQQFCFMYRFHASSLVCVLSLLLVNPANSCVFSLYLWIYVFVWGLFFITTVRCQSEISAWAKKLPQSFEINNKFITYQALLEQWSFWIIFRCLSNSTVFFACQ